MKCIEVWYRTFNWFGKRLADHKEFDYLNIMFWNITGYLLF